MTKEEIAAELLSDDYSSSLLSVVVTVSGSTRKTHALTVAEGSINELGDEKTMSEYTEHCNAYVKANLI